MTNICYYNRQYKLVCYSISSMAILHCVYLVERNIVESSKQRSQAIPHATVISIIICSNDSIIIISTCMNRAVASQ